MDIFRETKGVQTFALAQRSVGKRIALVPTMGFLHEGHLSLIREARRRADIVIVSIFVNPIQFGPSEDLEAYPRDEVRDLSLCEREGVTAVFIPPPCEMYENDASILITENQLSKSLCGLRRPTHFQGVCTVVAKLFNLAQPHYAIFGQKDFQQAAIIKRMVRDLNFPIEIIVAPIVREADGLAMSSRNSYLTSEERANAVGLIHAINTAQALVDQGERDVDTIRKRVYSTIIDYGLRPDYIEFVDEEALTPKCVIDHRTHILIAAFCGKTRLIDNSILILNH